MAYLDYLATQAVTHAVPGVAEHALTMKRARYDPVVALRDTPPTSLLPAAEL